MPTGKLMRLSAGGWLAYEGIYSQRMGDYSTILKNYLKTFSSVVNKLNLYLEVGQLWELLGHNRY